MYKNCIGLTRFMLRLALADIWGEGHKAGCAAGKDSSGIGQVEVVVGLLVSKDLDCHSGAADLVLG